MTGQEGACSAHVRVRDASAAAVVRAEARRVASALGWPAEAAEELAICASELVMNVVDHAAGYGEIAVVAADDRAWIELGSRDHGGSFDFARVGVPSRPGRGGGLPTLGRLMDVTTLAAATGDVLVLARRWGPEPGEPVRRRAPIRATLVQRARTGERECGDAGLVDRRGGITRLAVVDGLGHGAAAAEAARACTRALAGSMGAPLEDAVRHAHEALASTRGAALAVVDLDEARRTGACAVVGNCRIEVLEPAGRRSIPGVGAVLGHPRPGGGRWAARVERVRLAPGSALALSSDGVSSRATLGAPPRPDRVLLEACRLFAAHASGTDDSTLLVATLD